MAEVELAGPDLGKEGIDVGALLENVPSPGHFDGKPVVVIRTGGGLRVVGGSCPHWQGPLQKGLCEGGRIHCPWHHAVFDLETGEALAAPALDPLAVYETAERHGRVYVLGRFQQPAVKRSPPAEPESVVIVGAGAAGAAAAETLRQYGFTNPITLIGEEPPVDRPNLSKDYLAGTAKEEWIPLRSDDFYPKHGIELLAQRTVVGIDPTDRSIETDDGRRLRYGALLLATGAEPRRLSVEGGGLPHVRYLRSLDDSRSILSAINEDSKVAIVGAGFIGLEVAASLRHRDLEVAVIAPEEIPLANVIGPALGRMVRDLHEDHGVVFHREGTVSEIHPDHILLDGGEKIPADLVVVGIGVTPRSDLAERAGLIVDNGVRVDSQLRTTDPHIWAAGDLARYPHPKSGAVRIEHWVLAQRQGQTAARNMIGHNLAFTDPPFFWSQHYDVRINMVGYAHSWDEEVIRGSTAGRSVLVGYRKDGAIRAVASVRRDLDSLLAEQALAADDQPALEALLAG